MKSSLSRTDARPSGSAWDVSGWPKRVLLVEDDPGDALLLKERLGVTDSKLLIDWVDGIRPAEGALAEDAYDVVLLDLNLGEIRGLQTLERILPSCGGIPVLVLTGGGDEQMGIEAVATGADDFLFKSELTGFALRRALRFAMERASARRSLALAEARTRRLIEASRYGVFRTNRHGTLIAANGALATTLDMDVDSLLGAPARFLLEALAAEDGALESSRRIEGREIQLRRADGTPLYALLDACRVEGPTPGSFEWEGFLHDVTQAREAEQHRRDAEKMRSLGQFSAGVAHDLNNLLTVVLGSIDGICSHVEVTPEAREDVETAQGAIERGAHLVRKILAFSRGDRLDRRPVDLAHLLQECESDLARLMPEGITLHVEGRPGVAVEGDPVAFEEILQNLVSNAVDATPVGGRIEVSAMIAPGAKGQDADRAVLCVRDTGAGIPPEVQTRMFEPFFSTKERLPGTGLGLPMVYGMVEELSGSVEVCSAVGMGTSIRLYLPLTDGVVESAVQVAQPARVPPGRRSNGPPIILFVDDEADIRKVAERALRRMGYEVIIARDGEEGGRLFEANREVIDLVISDVVMPRESGAEMMRRIRAIRPEVAYFFTSGYSAADLSRDSTLDPSEPLLRKPWSIDELLAAVAERIAPPEGKSRIKSLAS